MSQPSVEERLIKSMTQAVAISRLRGLESDTNAVIKFILTELDELAALPPATAAEPYALEDRKRRIKRRLWDHHRAFLREER